MSKLNDVKYFRYKSIRDPLYGFINLSKKEIDLIDSPSFRRLQNIKQLSHTHTVYPSATHTRFEHSLGALHIAGRMCDQLGIDKTRKELIRQTMLLHDVGHGPFSHLFESVIQYINDDKFSHENITSWIIDEDQDIKSIVRSNGKKIIKILKKDIESQDWESKGYSLNSDIVASALDADKLDYLRRDSYHIGVMYGQFDLERILYTLKQTSSGDRIAVDQKGKDALESYRLGRYLMHTQVYKHHARVVADQMFLKALKFAVDDDIIDVKALKTTLNGSHKKFLKYYLTLNDSNIYQMILEKKNCKAAKILQAINDRKFLKRVCEFNTKSINDYEIQTKISKLNTDKFTNELALDAKINSKDIIVYLSNIEIELYGAGDILVLDNKGNSKDFTELSPISAKDTIAKLFVFGPPDESKKKKILKAVSDRLRIPSDQLI